MSNNINNKEKKIVVRILGYGQYIVDDNVMHEINTVDNKIVKLLESGENDDSVRAEFERHLKVLNIIVEEKGNAIESKEILQSDVVIPGQDITLEEARKLFKGEGIVKDSDYL
ncbi:MAG: hypothetical protein H0X50_07295 [Nitrosopumilus sp.]|nr:hypothetical protein [Nitrosopumilus sp.]